MTKNNILKIVLSAIFFVVFLIASIILIIIPSSQQVNLETNYTYRDTSEEFLSRTNVSFDIKNNSNGRVKIDNVTILCYQNNGSYEEKILYENFTIEKNDTLSIDTYVYVLSTNVSHFEIQFKNARVIDNNIYLFVGLGLLLPMVICGYLFTISLIGGIKEIKNKKEKNKSNKKIGKFCFLFFCYRHIYFLK